MAANRTFSRSKAVLMLAQPLAVYDSVENNVRAARR